jgi:hypothetical protein
MANTLNRFAEMLSKLLKMDRRLDEVKINQGRILVEMQRFNDSTRIEDYEFKVFSQWGEDGIIQYLVRNLRIGNKTFIEFGVEDFSESNCRFLMQKDVWSGFVIDGSEDNIARLQASDYFWRNNLTAKTAFITRENVDSLLHESGFDRQLGILSVDIDGVDYHVLEALGAWNPAILIVEYNAIFGYGRAVSVPYAADFQRSKRHVSNLYYGASLPAFAYLADKRGYGLVGVNSVGSNAFFVRRDLLNDRVCEVAVADVRRDAAFREARDDSGALTFATQRQSRARLNGLPLVDVTTGRALTVGDLDESDA